jgi:hypothetical protein
VTTDGVEYYIYAVDNFGVSSTLGTPAVPIAIRNPNAFVLEKEAIINFFLSESFYTNGEQQARSYVNVIKSKINNGTYTNADIEALRRLTLVEEALKGGYPGARDITQLCSKTSMQLGTAITLEFVFAKLGKALERFKDKIRPIYDRIQGVVGTLKTVRSGIRNTVVFQIGNRLSPLLRSVFGLSPSVAQSFSLTISHEIFRRGEAELADQALDLIAHFTGLDRLENAAQGLFLQMYESGFPMIFPGLPGVIYVGGTERVLQSSVSDASSQRFTEGNIGYVTNNVRQAKIPQIINSNNLVVQRINGTINFAELLDKIGLVGIILVAIIAVIAGILACPVGGLGCIISFISGLAIWGALSSLLTFFNYAKIAMYSFAIASGLFQLQLSLPFQSDAVRKVAFDRTTTVADMQTGSFTWSPLADIPTRWADSMIASTNRVQQQLSRTRSLIQQNQWNDARIASDSLSQFLQRWNILQSINNDILGTAYQLNGETRPESDSLVQYASAYAVASQMASSFAEFALGVAFTTTPTGTLKDSLVALMDSSAARIQPVASRYRTTFNQFNVWGFQVPTIISIIDARIVNSEAGYDVYARIKNISTINATDVVTSLRSPDSTVRLHPTGDTLVATLNAEEEREFQWHVDNPGDKQILMLQVSVHPLVEPGDFQGTTRIISEVINIDTSPVPPPPLNNTYAYPNPFNPNAEVARIRFTPERDGRVSITVFDVSNTKVRQLVADLPVSAARDQSIQWEGRNERGDIVANGVYFYIIESSSGERAVGKIAVLR